MLFDCGAGLAFDPPSQQCRPWYAVDGCHPPAAAPDVGRRLCAAVNTTRLHAHPDHCGRMFTCVNGTTAFVFECPRTRPHWNAAAQACAPNVDGCRPPVAPMQIVDEVMIDCEEEEHEAIVPTTKEARLSPAAQTH